MQENGMLARGQYAFEDLQVGMSAELLRTVMESDVVAFARLSGDDNPIHLSEAFAAATPFGGRIAHGLFTASLNTVELSVLWIALALA
jgi:3-hydroxybutyryl-CoA dehydratase